MSRTFLSFRARFAAIAFLKPTLGFSRNNFFFTQNSLKNLETTLAMDRVGRTVRFRVVGFRVLGFERF